MSDIKSLKQALIDELNKQIDEGVTVLTKGGEIEQVSVPASVLGVAAKVVKDFAEEAQADENLRAEVDKLDRFLEKRRSGAAIQ